MCSFVDLGVLLCFANGLVVFLRRFCAFGFYWLLCFVLSAISMIVFFFRVSERLGHVLEAFVRF